MPWQYQQRIRYEGWHSSKHLIPLPLMDGIMEDDDDTMSVDEEDEPPLAETGSQASGHGRLRKARDVPERRDSFDVSPKGEETRSNSSADGEHSCSNGDHNDDKR
mmetsp:Transcript_24427/g.20787  ORF Transcript_24427/g.20787 Transcript_24427/m.20787 type:complete len:105 (+) Transcript_24427:480-794(+)